MKSDFYDMLVDLLMDHPEGLVIECELGGSKYYDGCGDEIEVDVYDTQSSCIKSVIWNKDGTLEYE